MTFPVDRINERTYEPTWSGEVFACDIDRTYLLTRFSSLKGLASIPFEFAIDKQDIAGMAALLREVRRGPGRQSRSTPLYFISASPAQLRPVIQRKMLLDGLEFDGTTFKDWLGVLAGRRLRRFKEQLGFKITALLLLLRELPRGARLVLLGDDLETDALAFCLFADAVAGRVVASDLQRILLRHGVGFEDAQGIADLLGAVDHGPRVIRALIRLERFGGPEALLDYWPAVVACRGAFQMALGLWALGSISAEGVGRVAGDLLARGSSRARIEEHLVDCCRRGIISGRQAKSLGAEIGAGNICPTGDLPAVAPPWSKAGPDMQLEPWTPLRHRR